MSTLKVDTIIDADGGDTTTINSGTPVSTTSTQVAKAWVNFDGTGTIAIREHYNVSSLTDNGTGYYTITFSTAMADANYAFIGQGGDSGASYRVLTGPYGAALTTTTADVRVTNSTGTAVDPDYVSAVVFR